ncbi:MAG: hypothetical protein KA783_09055 [Chitinophagales bacterium]|jgi:hypothetical protein|nr:hypothetical protein [Chitinophagales bacterium]MBP7534586.1 hypothetical protein [Chitinophagales bacterium]
MSPLINLRFIGLLLFCFFITACTAQFPLRINQTREYTLKKSNNVILLKASVFGRFVRLTHELQEGQWAVNVDSLKLFAEGTRQNIVKYDCKYKPCIAVKPLTQNSFTVMIPINKIAKNTVYLLPCNYISCNGKTLTDTLRIQIPPRTKR